jgi:putative protease
VDALRDGHYTPERIVEWTERLRTVFNRGFWQGGYYCGEKLGEWSASGHSQATQRRIQIGVIGHYYAKPGVAEFRLFQERLQAGDSLLIEGPTTGALHLRADAMRVNEIPAETACKGDLITLAVPARVRLNDKIYRHINEESPSI